MKTSKRTNSNRRGAAMVEFAIVAIPMFMIIFGCIEFTRVSMMESLAEDAAYEACRHVVVAGAQKSEAIAEANRILGFLGTREATVTVTALDLDNNPQNELDDETLVVTVDVEIPMEDNLLYLSYFTKDVIIKKTTTMSTERYSGYFDGQGNN